QGLRRGFAGLRRVHNPQRRHLLAANLQPRAARDRVRALRRVRSDGRDAAPRWRKRPARRARARAAPALPGGRRFAPRGRGSRGRVRIQSDVYVTAGAVVEDDVFVGPGVVTTNDDTMGRHGPDDPLRGPVLRRACRVGGGAVLVPGVEIGEEAFVAAGAVVTRDVPSRAVVMGVPAEVVREVPPEDLLERWR